MMITQPTIIDKIREKRFANLPRVASFVGQVEKSEYKLRLNVTVYALHMTLGFYVQWRGFSPVLFLFLLTFLYPSLPKHKQAYEGYKGYAFTVLLCIISILKLIVK